MPAAPDTSKQTDALRGLSTGSGLKPASFGRGGAAGMPSMPLQPSFDGESAPRTAGAAAGGPGLGRGIPGVGGAMGGGGMGMPMGAPGAGQGQGAGKSKRGQGDESLYTKERPSTEAIIGNRRRKEKDGQLANRPARARAVVRPIWRVVAQTRALAPQGGSGDTQDVDSFSIERYREASPTVVTVDRSKHG
jgi:hypothetical protein